MYLEVCFSITLELRYQQSDVDEKVRLVTACVRGT